MADEKVYDFPTHGRRSEAAKARAGVKQSILKALADPRGGENEAFFIALKISRPEVFAALCGKLIPVEVQGQLDASLTVNVVTQDSSSGRTVVPR